MIHIVNRLTFELECPGEEQAFEIRQMFSQAGNEKIAGIIDKVCSKYAAENEWVRIDKLEINLGEFDLVSFEQEFSNVFVRKFESIIAERLTGIPKETHADSKAGSDLELLEYFLLKGHLPWWGDDNYLDPDEICSSVFKNRQAEILNFFRGNFNNHYIWERASFQLKSEFLTVLIQSFYELLNAHDILVLMLKKVSNELNLIEEYKRANFTDILQKVMEKAINVVVFNAPLIFAAGNEIQKIRTILAELAILNIVEFNNDSVLQENIVNIFKSVYENIFISGLEREHGTAAVSSKVNEEADSITGKTGIIDSRLNEEVFISGDDEKEKLIVRNAGVILAAPFLKTYFTKLGLLDKNLWISLDAQFRGIFLLKYLSSGTAKSFEYQLILEKLLCGIALEVPVPSEIILNDSEKEESELLLKSIIENWKVLKNTSINGLRETFLKRGGIIKKKESSWLLQIERKTVDVLLESIPWGFSTIGLPWNEYLIITEW
jgi:hypothetical protein